MPTFPWLAEEQKETDAQKVTDPIPKEVLAPTGTLPPAPPQHSPTPGSSAGEDAATLPQRFGLARPEANSCSGARREARRRPPSPGAHLSGARRRRRLPVSSSHGSGPAGGDHALLHLPPPSPAGINAAAEGCFPRYYNNQQATARSEPLRRRPPAARTTLGCGR